MFVHHEKPVMSHVTFGSRDSQCLHHVTCSCLLFKYNVFFKEIYSIISDSLGNSETFEIHLFLSPYVLFLFTFLSISYFLFSTLIVDLNIWLQTMLHDSDSEEL